MAIKMIMLIAALSCARAALISAPVGYHGYAGLAAPAYAAHAYAAPAYAAPAYASPFLPKVAVAAPAIAKVAVPEPYDPNPQYSFSYAVQDALTGDNKGQQETRSGDVVQGSYTLVEPDGNRRTVEYTADPVHGFNAVVHREPAVVAKAVVPAVAKVVSPLGLARPYGYPALAAPAVVGGHYYG